MCYFTHSISKCSLISVMCQKLSKSLRIKWRWNHSCSPQGAYLLVVDAVQIPPHSHIRMKAVKCSSPSCWKSRWLTAVRWVPFGNCPQLKMHNQLALTGELKDLSHFPQGGQLWAAIPATESLWAWWSLCCNCIKAKLLHLINFFHTPHRSCS